MHLRNGIAFNRKPNLNIDIIINIIYIHCLRIDNYTAFEIVSFEYTSIHSATKLKHFLVFHYERMLFQNSVQINW